MGRMSTSSFCAFKTWPPIFHGPPPALLARVALPQRYAGTLAVKLSSGPALLQVLEKRCTAPSIKPLYTAQNSRLSPIPDSFLSSSPCKSFIWKFSINKVLGRISNQPNRSLFFHSGNNAIGKSKQGMGRQSSPLFTGWDGEREAAHFCSSFATAPASFNLSLPHTSPLGVSYMSRKTGDKLSSHMQRQLQM